MTWTSTTSWPSTTSTWAPWRTRSVPLPFLQRAIFVFPFLILLRCVLIPQMNPRLVPGPERVQPGLNKCHPTNPSTHLPNHIYRSTRTFQGLNVFNTAFVLAKPETATDTDYERIEGVIAHEYFHNWCIWRYVIVYLCCYCLYICIRCPCYNDPPRFTPPTPSHQPHQPGRATA